MYIRRETLSLQEITLRTSCHMTLKKALKAHYIFLAVFILLVIIQIGLLIFLDGGANRLGNIGLWTGLLANLFFVVYLVLQIKAIKKKIGDE